MNNPIQRFYFKIHNLSLLVADAIREYHEDGNIVGGINISNESLDYLHNAYYSLRRSLPEDEITGKHFRSSDAAFAIGKGNETMIDDNRFVDTRSSKPCPF